MNCTMCDAGIRADAPFCVICGKVTDVACEKQWDRTVEAMAYQDLTNVLDEGESLLGYTRGRIAGSWRRIVTLNPQTLISPYVNVGLTAGRLVTQQINQTDGEASSDRIQSIWLKHLTSVTLSDADPFSKSKMMRLSVVLTTGDSFRVRAPGRLGELAAELANIFKTISVDPNIAEEAVFRCINCEKSFQRNYQFCPFCGKQQLFTDLANEDIEI